MCGILEVEKIQLLAEQARLESEAVVPVSAALARARWNCPQKMVALSYPPVRCS